MALIYGRPGLPDWQQGTASVANGSTAVTLVGAGLQTTDPTTQALLSAASRGDLFVVPGIGAKFISAVTSANALTLIEPWTYATQTNVAYNIIRFSLPATGSVAKAVTDLQNLGTDTSPDTVRVIDDSTGRLKLKMLAGLATIAVGPTGTADASLKAGIQFALATGIASFPNGAIPPADWTNNRIDNGGFDIWQLGTSFTIANNAALTHIADRWFVQNVSTSSTITMIPGGNVAGISSPNSLNLSAPAVAVGGGLYLSQRFEGAALSDLGGSGCVLSFDLVSSTTAGTLTGTLIVYTNTALDNGTFATLAASPVFTVPASGRVTIALTAAQCANLNLGAVFQIRFLKGIAAGDVNITIGGVALEKGQVASGVWAAKPPQLEMLAAQRYLQVSWPIGYTQANAPYPLLVYSPSVAIANAATFPPGICFDPPMRASPTVTLYDTAATAGKVTIGGTVGQAATAQACATFIAQITNGTGAAITAGSKVQFHYLADARL